MVCRKSAGIPGVAVLVWACKRPGGLGFSLPSCESGWSVGNQRAFRVLQSWSVRAISGHSGCCSPGLCKSAGIPGVAVLVCANQRAFRVLQSWSVQISGHSGCCSPGLCKSPPGRKFRHAAYNIDMCRGEAESPKTRFTWPAWRSNYFPGV